MKVKMLVLVLGVILLIPGAVSANGNIPESYLKVSGNFHNGKEFMDKNWHEKMKMKEQKLLSMVSVYTPEKKTEWVKIINERNKMREKWLSPEFAEKRALWKKEKMSKIKEFQKQYDEGKMTKEEFIKKVHGSKPIGNRKTYNELKVAVQNKNNKKAALLLNQLLVQYKQQNEWMKAAMNNLSS